jgi:plastocyanin
MQSRIAKLADLVSAAAIALVIGTGPAEAQAVGTPVLALPGAFQLGYATPVIVTQVGGTITFVSADIPPHNVCIVYGPLDHRCSSTVGLGGTATDTPTGDLASGSIYEFFCSIHPDTMRGTLVAV